MENGSVTQEELRAALLGLRKDQEDEALRHLAAAAPPSQLPALDPALEARLLPKDPLRRSATTPGLRTWLSALRHPEGGGRLRRSSALLGLAAMLLLAPLLHLWLSAPSTRGTLVAMTLNVTGDNGALGSADTPQPLIRVHEDGRLRVDLSPRDPVSYPLQVDAYLRRSTWERWSPPLKAEADGAFHLDAQVQTLPGLLPGHYEVAFVIAREGRMPPEQTILAYLQASSATESPDFRVLRRQILILPHEVLPTWGAPH